MAAAPLILWGTQTFQTKIIGWGPEQKIKLKRGPKILGGAYEPRLIS